MQTKQFEYLSLDSRRLSEHQPPFINELEQLGYLGWELCGFNHGFAFLKREKTHRKHTAEEQKLVDICFQLCIFAATHDWFKNQETDGVAKWVADQLLGCGFPTKPCGASHGVLE
jgi:hypothetical protein